MDAHYYGSGIFPHRWRVGARPSLPAIPVFAGILVLPAILAHQGTITGHAGLENTPDRP